MTIRDESPIPRGLAWILFANLAIAIDYSMIMPTGWQYIDDMDGSKLFYGATTAAFPIGRIVFLLPFGAWSDRHNFAGPFAAASIIGMMGGLVYGMASVLGSRWFAMLGRFLGGCGATLPLSAWAARSYPPEKRVQIESLQKAAQLIGVSLGPAVNAVFYKLDWRPGPFRLNALTMAGYFPAIMSFVLLLGFRFGVEEPPRQERPVVPPRRSEPLRRLTTTGAWCCIFNAFHTNVQVSAVDTILAPLNVQHLHWSLLGNSVLFAVLAVISFIGAVIGILANKRGIKPMNIILFGLTLNVLSVSWVCWLLRNAPEQVNMHVLLVVSTLTIWAIMLYTGSNGGVYQQTCGDSQGLLGAIYTIAFAGGRPLGAMLGGGLLEGNTAAFCSVLPTCAAVALLLQFQFRGRLQRAEDDALMSRQLNEQDCSNTCGMSGGQRPMESQTESFS